MQERVIWFVLGTAVASVFWLIVLKKGLGRQWYDALLRIW